MSGPHALPLTGPAARPIWRGMKLWCDPGQHADPRPVRCDRCGGRACPRHSHWVTPPRPARAQRVCDDCTRKEAQRGTG